MSGLNAALIHNSRKHFPKRDGRHRDRLPILMGPISSPKTTTYLRSRVSLLFLAVLCIQIIHAPNSSHGKVSVMPCKAPMSLRIMRCQLGKICL